MSDYALEVFMGFVFPDSYAIFPFLRTSEPVWCCGLMLRGSQDVDDLAPEHRAHLETLFPMFFFADHFRVKGMTYAVLSGSDEVKQAQYTQRLARVQTLLAYIYSSPGGDGKPFFHYEHANCYRMWPSRVSKWSLWHEGLTECLWPADILPEFNEWSETDGYHGLLNNTIDITAVPGSRIFPPTPGLWLNHSQDVAMQVKTFAGQPHNWALIRLFDEAEPHPPMEFTTRVLNALEWHNRSSAIHLSEDVALLHLAIALECLLNLEPGEGVTKRFKETVATLVGPVPLLDSWLEQFYAARSNIVHEGASSHLAFYPVDKKRLTTVWKGQDATPPYGLLAGHGRRVFRLCLHAIVTGAMMAQEMNLAGAMVPNGERMQRICRALTASTSSPQEKLLAIRRDMLDLNECWLFSSASVDAETLCAVARELVRVFFETKPSLPDEVEESLRLVLGFDKSAEMARKLELLNEAAKSIGRWKGDTPFHWQINGVRGQMQFMREDGFNVVRAFFDYAALPHHRLGKYGS